MQAINEYAGPRIQHLDLLRGLAILSVVAVHSGLYADAEIVRNNGTLYPQFSYLISLGKYGVELFFFISGFLLSTLYMKEMQFNPIKYFKRRIGRIYPLWLVFLLVAISRSIFWESGNNSLTTGNEKNDLSLIDHPLVIFILGALFLLWIFENLWNVVIPGGWSIQAEVGHYLLFPFMRRYSYGRILKFSLGINLFTTIIYFSLPFMGTLPSTVTLPLEAWIRLNLYATFGYFLLGMLLAQVAISYQQKQDLRRLINEIEIPNRIFAYWLGTFLLVPLSFGKQVEALGFLVLCLLSSFGLREVTALNKILSSLGRYSYFIYFAHFLALEFIAFGVQNLGFKFNFFLGQVIAFGGIIVACLAISWFGAVFSHKYFESYFIRLSRR